MCERIRAELGRRHGRRHRRPRPGSSRRCSSADQPRRAVAHPARPAPHLREERRVTHDAPRTASRSTATDGRAPRRRASTASSRRRRRPGDRRSRVAGRLMLRRVQGKLAFATLRDGSGGASSCSPGRGHADDFDGFGELSLGDWIGVTGEVMTTKRGRAVGARSTSWMMLAETRRGVPRQVARHHRRRHPLPPALRRPVGQPESRASLPAAQPDHEPHPAVARGPRLHRGRDAGLPPDPRRRAGQAVHHPPQRPRPGALPAHRARAVPEAPRRRRLRAGVRDRPGCSATRASRPATTPSSRCSSSTRPTATTTT